MKILHITPHLGGGVGKAHAAIAGALPKEAQQTFVLLEQARDRRFVEAVAAAGGRVITAGNLSDVADLAGSADIVQFEFWNHPRLFECLACAAFPPIRSVFWSHISGLARPVIQPGLIEQAGRFVFTTEASRSIPTLAKLPAAAQRKLAIINSGFGFTDPPRRDFGQNRTPVIAYLGTVNFVKMHPGFFDAVDRLNGRHIQVCIWGAIEPSSPVLASVLAMRHPERIHFRGHTSRPAAALAGADIFFYPLQSDHFGTAENALIEAMSLGLVPVVLNNPAETAIVRHGETGLVARSIDECTTFIQMLLSSPHERERISRNAIRAIAETRTPARSAQQFMDLWQGLLGEEPQRPDFRAVIGERPADWFLATQRLQGESWSALGKANLKIQSKGMLAHFESVFSGDESLARLVSAG
jgi:glycosyltransferase involved in cell wall biosynthesis